MNITYQPKQRQTCRSQCPKPQHRKLARHCHIQRQTNERKWQCDGGLWRLRRGQFQQVKHPCRPRECE